MLSLSMARVTTSAICAVGIWCCVRSAQADFLVASALTDSVVRYNDNGGLKGDFITPGSGGLNSPYAMEYGPDGQTLYVGGAWSIWVYNRFTGAPLGTLPVPSAMWDGLSFAPNGDLFASDLGGKAIYRFDSATGATIARITTPGVDNPNHMLRLPDGRLLVAGANGKIYSIDMNQNVITGTFAQLGATSSPMGLVLGPDGYVYVADSGRNKGIVRLDPSTGANLGMFATAPTGGYYSDLVFTAGNRLWADQLLSGTLDRFNASTGVYVDTVFSPGDSWDLLHMPEPGTLTTALLMSCGWLLQRRRTSSV
jgi:sugar lactone lactonase YvrE